VLRMLAPTFFMIPLLIPNNCTVDCGAGALVPPGFVPFWVPLAMIAAVSTPFIDWFALGYEQKPNVAPGTKPTVSVAAMSAGRIGLSLSITDW
jgi:hypothetical protein